MEIIHAVNKNQLVSFNVTSIGQIKHITLYECLKFDKLQTAHPYHRSKEVVDTPTNIIYFPKGFAAS